MSTPHILLRRVVVVLTVRTLSLTLVHLVPIELVAPVGGVVEGITLLCQLGSIVEPIRLVLAHLRDIQLAYHTYQVRVGLPTTGWGVLRVRIL